MVNKHTLLTRTIYSVERDFCTKLEEKILLVTRILFLLIRDLRKIVKEEQSSDVPWERQRDGRG